MWAKLALSSSVTVRGCSSAPGTMWSGSRGSSRERRGQVRLLSPSSHTCGRGARGERRGVHPGDRCRGLDAVRHAEVGERRLEGRRRRPHQGAAPDQPGRAAQQGFPDLPRRVEAAGDEVDGEQDGGDDVRRGLVGREPLPPSLRRVEHEAAGQVPGPALRQGAEGRAVPGDGPGEAQHAIAIEPLQQQVGQGRAGLAVAGRQGAPAVREMHVDVRLGRERQHEVVVVARRRGRDGDVARRDAAGEMAAGPAEGLHHLVTRAGAARDRHLGPFGSGGLDRHRGGPDPVGHGAGPRRPTGRDGPGDRHDEGAPAGIDLRHGAELHLAQHPGGVAQPLDRPGDEVGRPAHARREAVQRGRFDARQGRQALIAGRSGARREVDAGRPCLRQGRAERTGQAGEARDGGEIGEVACGHLADGVGHGIVQGVAVDPAEETAGQPCGEPLDRGHDRPVVVIAREGDPGRVCRGRTGHHERPPDDPRWLMWN